MKQYFIKEEVNRIDLLDERWYEIHNGDEVFHFPGVTTYLEAFPKGYGFRNWLKATGFNSEIIFERAGAFGSQFHSLIERTLHGDKVKFVEHETDIRLWERFLIWCEFWKELNAKCKVEFDPAMIEFTAYDIETKSAGTVDFLATVDGKNIVMDWKSGNWVEDEAEMQISEYARMTQKLFNIEINEARICHFPDKKPNKKGYKIKVIDKDAIKVNCEDFRHVQAVWRRANPNAKPKYLQYPTEIDLKFIQENEIIKEARHENI